MRARFERLRVDIVDFEPCGAPLLQGAGAATEGCRLANPEGSGFGPSTRPWVALGKHLCGAATDLTLRCCARRCARARDPDKGFEPASRPSSRAHGPGTEQRCTARLAAAHGAAAASGSSPAGSPGGGLRECHAAEPGRGLLGLALATCCHHRCTWRDFVGKLLFVSLGFTPAEFEVICYMCAWANGGHDAAPGGASSRVSRPCEGPSGSHVRTAWANGGHDAEPGGAAAASRVPEPCGGPEGLNAGRACANGGQDAAPGGAAASSGQPEPCKLRGGVGSGRANAVGCHDAMPSGAAAGVRDADPGAGFDRVEAGCGAPAAPGSEQQASDGEGAAQGSNGIESCALDFQPYFLPIERRMALGAAAKQLIDAARVHYLRGEGLGNARAVQYVSQQVSCENRLLVASTTCLNEARTTL